MRFHWYPLDSQICKFRIGSYGNDYQRMTFQTKTLSFDKVGYNAVLDYSVEVLELAESDAFYLWDAYQNFSLAGFEIRLKRQSLKYLVNYFLPSGLFVVASWVMRNFNLKYLILHLVKTFKNKCYIDQFNELVTIALPSDQIYMPKTES